MADHTVEFPSKREVTLAQTNTYTITASIGHMVDTNIPLVIINWRSHVTGKCDQVLLGAEEMNQLVKEWQTFIAEHPASDAS